MDGGRRILRSLREASRALAFGASPHVRPAFAGAGGSLPATSIYAAPQAAAAPRSRRRARRVPLGARLLALLRKPGIGSILVILLIATSGIAGTVIGGEYESFVAQYGRLRDVGARLLGFGIDAVTITGDRELAPKEVLDAAGISPRNSLVFLDVEAAREGLIKLPLVKDASVRKLYPDQVVIALTERKAFALWQQNGKLQVVAQDGTPIDALRDSRFTDLPFVVGQGANEHVDDYMKLLAAAGDLRSHVKAGMWVGDRRWDLKLDSGLEIRLPEIGADKALSDFAKLAHDNGILGKDLIVVDLRMPGRLVVRLSEDAAAAREAALGRKKGKGGP